MGSSTSFTTWSDVALIDEAKRLVAAERGATAALLRALMEIDARNLYLGEGCPSLFAYCTEVLHLAEGKPIVRTVKLIMAALDVRSSVAVHRFDGRRRLADSSFVGWVGSG